MKNIPILFMLKGVGIDLFNNKDSKNNGKSLKVFAIGNQNILLIVSNFGHFDLRIDKRSVVGKVFDRKNLYFTGKSPKFKLTNGNDTKRLEKYDLVLEEGIVKMQTDSAEVCFTVDTKNKKMLIKAKTCNAGKEYFLKIGNTVASVNSPDFDKCAQELAQLSKKEKNRYLLKESYTCIKMLCLAMALWDFEALSAPKSPIGVEKIPTNLICQQPPVIKMPACYSATAYAFAREVHRNKEYLKNCMGLEAAAIFCDLSNVYPRIDSATPKNISGDEAKLAMAVSSCCIELSADFDSYAACDEAMERICRRKTAWTFAKSPLISSHEMGVMRLDIHENKSMTTRFDFGSMGSLEICHQIFGQKNGEEHPNVFGNAKTVKVTRSAAKLVSENQCLLIGTDPKYPFQLAFMSNEGDSHGFFYSFNAKVLNFELSDLFLKQENCLGAKIFVPMLYYKKQICFFVKKMTSDLGCAFISGAFVLGRDALFYKALECYGSAQSVQNTLLKQLEEGERNSVFSENDRLKKAIHLCKWDAFGVRSKIFKTLCAQNIDGSIECKESAAKAVLEYINVKGNSDILHVKLPYTVDGILTSRREDVYTHLMRRAEAQREKESREILEHLGYMYYHGDQL